MGIRPKHFSPGPPRLHAPARPSVTLNQMARSIILLALTLSTVARAQSPNPSPAFEVASVKPNPDARGREVVDVSPIGVALHKASLGFCLQWAYSLRLDQVAGPEWLNRDRFDIDARAAAPTPESRLRLMLQALLAERFRLGLHRETKDLAVYEMAAAKSGPKLTPSTSAGANPQVTAGSYVIPHVSMADFALRLRELGAVDLPVVDRTNLQGVFDITLRFADGWRPSTRPDPGGVSIFTILEQQLGLRLELRKSPAEILIVDQAERTPTAN